MPQEKNEPAPPYHSNVVSGPALEKLAEQGFRSMGIVHHFEMRWDCGHEGDAVEIMNYKDQRQGSLKACYQCAEKYRL
ncbi:hypothetical protein COV20_06125 [Candidatus Woesearchaeota archaeon CG10_big_fil_rev_8_21_14_0_10_45_16]|nr:MAG: hypothetical protein COV20_06125 [Candidatus Woesearchaeota archaeon CG10_big_fil_rev_8_21_14_0_10_45_16]